jgi:hypothetical protein
MSRSNSLLRVPSGESQAGASTTNRQTDANSNNDRRRSVNATFLLPSKTPSEAASQYGSKAPSKKPSRNGSFSDDSSKEGLITASDAGKPQNPNISFGTRSARCHNSLQHLEGRLHALNSRFVRREEELNEESDENSEGFEGPAEGSGEEEGTESSRDELEADRLAI